MTSRTKTKFVPKRQWSSTITRILASAVILPLMLVALAATAAEPLIFYGDDNTPPYEFLDRGEAKGLNVDLLRAIGKKLGRPVEIRLTSWTEAQAKVLAGAGHGLTMLTPTPEREKLWGFTEPTHTLSFSLFVRTKDVDRLRSMPIAMQRIGVQARSFSENHFRTHHPDVPLEPSRDFVDGLRDLLHGKIDAFAQITASGEYALEELSIGGITAVQQPFATRVVSVPVPKSNSELLQQIDGALHDMKRDGTFDLIVKRWSPHPVHVFNQKDIWLGAAVGGTGVAALLLLVAFVVRRRWLAEDSLRESEARFGGAFETAAHGMALVSTEGRFIKGNPSLCHMVGYSEAELQTITVQTLTHPDDIETSKILSSDLLAGRIDSGQTEKRYFHKNGSIVWAHLSVSLVRSSRGTPLHFVAHIQDISERKSNEAELIQHRLHLEEQIARRTEDLQAAKAEAERANRAKSRFLAAASHDLRQPLAALTVYVGLLRNTLAPSEQKTVANMQQCIGSLSELLTDLLDLSKLEAGIVTPTVSAFSIADVFATLESVHAPEAQIKGLRLRCVPSELTARTDLVLFRRCLGNLIDNAVRYTERGGVLVACRRRQGKTWVEVWDTGVGIPADKTVEVFEEFRQLGDGARNNGSGLGLAIVNKTAALLGLEINVRSRLGRGSVFAIELPLGQPALCEPEPALCAVGGRPVRIALVDDNPMVCDALAECLRALGHQVLATTTKAALLAELDQLPPDIVVSDYRLARGETGFDVITAVRAALGAELPAILITGDTEPQLLRSMTDRGIVVLHKPVDLETLQAYIEDMSCQVA